MDRNAPLEEAEQLIRQRKLDGAIEVHVRLGDGLDETARVLAVLIDLDLDSGGCRDARVRVDRLMLARTGSPGR